MQAADAVRALFPGYEHAVRQVLTLLHSYPTAEAKPQFVLHETLDHTSLVCRFAWSKRAVRKAIQALKQISRRSDE